MLLPVSASAPIEVISGVLTDVPAITTMLNQSLASHKELLRSRTEQIDSLNTQIRESSTLQKQEQDDVNELKERVRLRGERHAKIANLKRSIAEKRQRQSSQNQPLSPSDVDLPWLSEENTATLLSSSPDLHDSPTRSQRSLLQTSLPSSQILQTQLSAYTAHSRSLQKQANDLQSRSLSVEAMYRKVVSLCTGVEEDKVEESLPNLVAAVESERGGVGIGEVGRVREFLRRVDGVGGATAIDGSL